MSDYVVFHSDRLAAYEWDGKEKKDYVEKPFRLTDLRVRVKVDDGVTLGQIFAIVDQHPTLKEVVAHYAWCGAIDEFHAQAREPRKDLEESLVKLVVSSYGEVFEHDGTNDFNISTDFIGVDAQGERWSVSYSPMYQLAHIPVVIDETFTIRRNWTESILSGKRVLSLLEFLEGIYWDISFHGGPKENEEFLAEMKERINEVEEGRAELVPFEDVMRSLEDEQE
jgi:hypothetical protein